MKARTAAKALGWFSIGLGIVEIVAPGWIARQLGIADRPRLTRAFGAREVVTGAGILSSPGAPAGLWARVAGDVLDLGTLAAAARQSNRPGRAVAAMGSVAAVLAADALVAKRLSDSRDASIER